MKISKDEANVMESLYDKSGPAGFEINKVVYILHERKIKQLMRSVTNLLQRVKELESKRTI